VLPHFFSNLRKYIIGVNIPEATRVAIDSTPYEAMISLETIQNAQKLVFLAWSYVRTGMK